MDTQLYSLLLAPLFLWSAYHFYKDRHRPEPLGLLLLAIALGYGSAFIGLFLYSSLDFLDLRLDAFALANDGDIWTLLAYCILAIGPIEEVAKFVPFLLILSRLRHFNEAYDGVVYASLIGLGFALHENQSYLVYQDGAEAVGRSLASPIVHALFASIWGYAYGYADTHNMNRSVATLVGLLASMVLHGIYDFFALWISVWTHIVPAGIVLIIWVWRSQATIRHTRPLTKNNSSSET